MLRTLYKHLVLAEVGGVIYVALELAWRGRSHWTMFILGGVCFAAHPFRNNNRGLEENLRKVKGLHGLEVLNGSTSVEACQKAARYALELGLFTLGSSDCHVPEKVGVCATYFPERFHTMEGFLDAFRKGQMKPAYYAGGKYHVLELKEQQKSKIPFTFYAFNDRMYL